MELFALILGVVSAAFLPATVIHSIVRGIKGEPNSDYIFFSCVLSGALAFSVLCLVL